MTKYLNNQIIVIDTRFRNKNIIYQDNANFTVKISNNNNNCLKNVNKIKLVSMNFPPAKRIMKGVIFLLKKPRLPPMVMYPFLP